MDFIAQDVISKFDALYAEEPLIIRAPGRINLIGEHTDYNDGFVMPAAIDKEIVFAIAPSPDETSSIYSLSYSEFFYPNLKEPAPVTAPKWANYLLGVMRQLVDNGHTLKPFRCVFGGNIPAGSGLSSSAALETGFAFALNELNKLNIPTQKMIHMAQWAEHNYVGVKCGIMDQFASMMGADNKVILLDCRSLEYKYSPLKLDNYSIVLCNTGVKHSLVDSEYNTRRAECEQGVAILQRHYPEVKSLRDVTPEMVDKHKSEMPGKVYQRCFYVTSEIKRVQAAAFDLTNDDLEAFGRKMYETHEGLSSLYEVSCPELDFLVGQAKNAQILGSRMMGGGFGGCTINIVPNQQVESFISSATAAYKKAFNLDLIAYIVHVKSGTGLLKKSEKSAVGS
ncbi:galactokinase [Pseudochryseolinea flava]|uniref:galactokinase n=1 Tax=Pseudochryseolinea flava TaxID=2059302 RepID=UPI001FE97E8C|nr:galactokinase [Pseudochryseolinea flava]